jgi:hypothetical protein
MKYLDRKTGEILEVNQEKWNAMHNIVPYVQARMKAYPPVGEQLDMLYWDKVNGTDNWKQLVDSIKADNPKP